MKNKSVHNCQFVHHANFHCIMTTLNKVFKNAFERGGNWKRADFFVMQTGVMMTFDKLSIDQFFSHWVKFVKNCQS